MYSDADCQHYDKPILRQSLLFLCAGRFTSGESAPGTYRIWCCLGSKDGKFPWLSSPCAKRVRIKKTWPTRTNISEQFYGKLWDWPEGLSVVNVKSSTYVCTTAADTEPRTFQFLLCVTYTLVFSGSECGQFKQAIPISRRKWRPAWTTESGTRRTWTRNESARLSRGVILGISTAGKSAKSFGVSDPSTGICMVITLRNLLLIC